MDMITATWIKAAYGPEATKPQTYIQIEIYVSYFYSHLKSLPKKQYEDTTHMNTTPQLCLFQNVPQ